MSTEKKRPVAERVRELALPLAEELGLILWDVQFVKEGADWHLRLLIDKPGGVSIDDCVDMTHAIDPVLDEEDPIPQEYLLEVSSPGLERRLRRPEHFSAWLGKPVRVKLIRPLPGGVHSLEGLLLSAGDSGDIEVKLDDGTTMTVEKKEYSAVTTIEETEEDNHG